MKEIPLLIDCKEMKLINKGMSDDRKYFIVTKHNENFLLRLSDIVELKRKKEEYHLVQKLSELNIPLPKAIDFGVCNNGTEVYTLLTWIKGNEAEDIIPTLSNNEQYENGKVFGRILREIHQLIPADIARSWKERYFSVKEHKHRPDESRSIGQRHKMKLPGD